MPEAGLCVACRTERVSGRCGEALCPGCMSGAREMVPWPLWLFDSLLMRRVTAERNIAAMVAVFRAASGLSQQDVGGLTGWGGQPTVSSYERGRRDVVRLIDMVEQFADAVDMPAGALMPLMFRHPAVALADDCVLEALRMDMDRRGFGGVAAGAATAIVLPEVPVPSQVTASHVRYLQACVDSLHIRDGEVGGATLLGPALRQWQRVQRMLRESRYTEDIGRQLFAVAGGTAVCAGWLAFDGGDVALARRLYSEAQVMADNAGDPVLTAHVLTSQSDLLSYVARMSQNGHAARESLQLTYRAADEARYERMPRLHVHIAVLNAYAASLLGDRAAFRSAITRARRELDRGGPRADGLQWIGGVNAFHITGLEARGEVYLGGDPGASAALFGDTVADPGVSPRDRALRQAHLAAILATGGDLTEAVRQGMTVLSALEGGVASVRTLGNLRPVRVAAGASKRADAEEYRTRFDAAERTLNGLQLVR